MDFAMNVDEVIAQFTSKLGVDVKISVEIQSTSTREGFDEAMQRSHRKIVMFFKFSNAEFEDYSTSEAISFKDDLGNSAPASPKAPCLALKLLHNPHGCGECRYCWSKYLSMQVALESSIYFGFFSLSRASTNCFAGR